MGRNDAAYVVGSYFSLGRSPHADASRVESSRPRLVEVNFYKSTYMSRMMHFSSSLIKKKEMNVQKRNDKLRTKEGERKYHPASKPWHQTIVVALLACPLLKTCEGPNLHMTCLRVRYDSTQMSLQPGLLEKYRRVVLRRSRKKNYQLSCDSGEKRKLKRSIFFSFFSPIIGFCRPWAM